MAEKIFGETIGPVLLEVADRHGLSVREFDNLREACLEAINKASGRYGHPEAPRPLAVKREHRVRGIPRKQ
ncbi:MAG: hypothetical protein ACLFOY_00215 [Desulfatibacillaceae bacterium]